ncbi:Ger(x)C family spore germination protein [Paenibacillus sp. MMS20-IR301]|uniref:Ger(x)C family spore germination protein n=1 Tax=Paenibacillus sp. MMS20-IR301 TaxID=2895946 RepID=UPI0028EC0BA0|nr:Ger(x)C family spore germination protein [Paenibacillus sp. MMS20-IR301]WNS45999.1 Ger(x)C family spore germination protein [Paenibacillus sp. MMS20-IR301]
MFRKLICIVIALSLVLTGCWDRQELNDQAIVLGWGMDLTEEGDYLATANLVLPLASKSGGQQGGEQGGRSGFLTESAYGKNNRDAEQNMQRKLSRVLFPGHRRNIFIGEKLAQQSVFPILDEYGRSPMVRPRTNIFVVKGGTAQEAMSLAYQLETNPAIAVQKIQEKSGAPISRSLLDFFIMANGTGCGVMPALAIVEPERKIEKRSKNDSPPQTTLSLYGAAIFNMSLKLAGYLNYDEYWVRLWLTNRLAFRTFTTLINPVDAEESGGKRAADALSGATKGQAVTVNVDSFKSHIKPVFNDDSLPRFEILLEGNGFIEENDSPLNLSKLANVNKVEGRMNQYLEEKVKRVVTKVQKEFKCDIFGLGDLIHRNHPYRWKKLAGDWETIFPEVPLDIKVKLNLTGTGITGESLLPTREGGEK